MGYNGLRWVTLGYIRLQWSTVALVNVIGLECIDVYINFQVSLIKK